MNAIPSNEAISEAARIWEYAEVVLSDESRLHYLGFSGRDAVEQVVAIFRAGDRLHPTKGFDYLGPDWKKLERDTVLRLTDERDEAVEELLRAFLELLETQGYEAACRHAQSASTYQVLYTSRSQTETEQCFQDMFDSGLGTNEVSDNLLEKRGNSLVIGHGENISYYILPDTWGD